MRREHQKVTTIIFALVAFVCSVLITSLYVYRHAHQQTLTTFSNGNVTLFPVARDIQRFELLATDNHAFTQKNLLGHWTLLFFGFTHCASVCPVTLDVLKHTYDQLHLSYPNLQMVFITLDPDNDSLQRLTHFVHSFHPRLIGLTGKIQTIRQLQSQFGIFSKQDETQPNQLLHTANILLINPQGKWTGIFKYGMSANEFVSAFKSSVAIMSAREGQALIHPLSRAEKLNEAVTMSAGEGQG